MTAIDDDRFAPALRRDRPRRRPLASAVRGVLIHRDWAPTLGVEFAPERLADQHIRPVNEMLARLSSCRPNRSPNARAGGPHGRRMPALRGAVRGAAAARGCTAPARAGFSRYFGAGWVDHWIVECWDGRWVRETRRSARSARNCARPAIRSGRPAAGRVPHRRGSLVAVPAGRGESRRVRDLRRARSLVRLRSTCSAISPRSTRSSCSRGTRGDAAAAPSGTPRRPSSSSSTTSRVIVADDPAESASGTRPWPCRGRS